MISRDQNSNVDINNIFPLSKQRERFGENFSVAKKQRRQHIPYQQKNDAVVIVPTEVFKATFVVVFVVGLTVVLGNREEFFGSSNLKKVIIAYKKSKHVSIQNRQAEIFLTKKEK